MLKVLLRLFIIPHSITVKAREWRITNIVNADRIHRRQESLLNLCMVLSAYLPKMTRQNENSMD